MTGIFRVHICNRAVPEPATGWQLLGASWEDNNLESITAAQNFADYIEEHAPGAFVLVSTGDYIVPPCATPYSPEHVGCETYDPNYRFFLVPSAVWQAQQDSVMERDIAWREAQQACLVKPVEVQP